MTGAAPADSPVDSGKNRFSPRKSPPRHRRLARYQCTLRVWPNLPTAEFCAPKTRLAADWQWNSAAYPDIAEFGIYGCLLNCQIKLVYMSTLGLRKGPPHRREQMSETQRDYQIGGGKPPRGRPFQKGQPARSAPQEPIGAAGRGIERAGLRHDRREAAQDHQARGDRHADGQRIGRRQSARDQDAVRHDEGGRAEGGQSGAP